jgi:hypothetical protein
MHFLLAKNISRLNLKEDMESQQLVTLRKSLREKRSELGLLENEITNLELALDSAQATATLAKLSKIK